MHSLRIIASLGIAEGQATAFEAFERGAARIMRRRGRGVEHAIRPARGASSDAELPFEVRVLSFPGTAQHFPTHAGRKARTASRAPMLPASTRSVGLHHHFISPLLTLAPISSATIRPAAGYAVFIASISAAESRAFASSDSKWVR